MPDTNQNLPIGAEPQPLPVQSAPTTPPPATPTPPGTPTADAKAPAKPREWAAIDFPSGSNRYSLTITIITADGKTHTYGSISISTLSGKTARDLVYNDLSERGWSVA